MNTSISRTSTIRRSSSVYPSRYVIKQQNREGFLGACVRGVFLLFCACLSACLVFASYPSQSHSTLAWIAWVPFIWGIFYVRRAWVSFAYGWFTALLFHAGLFYWIYYTCLHGGGLSKGLSCAAWLGVSALLAVQFGLFGIGCYFLKKTGAFFPLLAACGFVTLEWLHQVIAFYGLGFPWLMWGYTQWNVPEFLRIASWTGVYGVSFLLVLVSAFLAAALGSKRFKRGFCFVFLAVAVWFGAYMWGDAHVPFKGQRATSNADVRVDVAIVQPNVDQYKKWNPQFEQEIVDTIDALGTGLENQGLMLTLWPESALPGDLLSDKYLNLMQSITLRTASSQLVGSSFEQDGKHYVSAFLMTPHEEPLQVYHKRKLVPFGEYVPFETVLRRFFPQVKILGEMGVFSPGPRTQPLLDMQGILLGSTICYEAIFPQLWRQQNKQGAKLFVNLTNDGWFFNTAAPYQHLAANVLRAVETGRPVLRSANTGFSAVIDPYGRVEQKSELFTQTVLQAQVPLAVEEHVNFYTQHGDLFVWICAVLFFTSFISTVVFSYE